MRLTRSLKLCFSKSFFSSKNTKPVKKIKKISHAKAIHAFFEENSHLSDIKKYIPIQYLHVIKKKTSETLYLICPETAKIIVKRLMPFLDSSNDQIISETSPGLGLIATELLDNGIPVVRLYEHCPDFREELKEIAGVYPGRVEIFTKNIFYLYRYAYLDKLDGADRVQSLFKNVPSHSWVHEPVITIVGTMIDLKFLKYLVKSLTLQNLPCSLGRIQIFALMKPRDYAILTAETKHNLHAYQKWTILFNLLLDYELLEIFPRQVFLPWDSPAKVVSRYPGNFETDKIYLVKINFKKQLPVSMEHLLPLLFFVLQFYGRGNNRIVPTVEKWVPGCGMNIIIPTKKYKHYFQEIDIFTRFRELTPTQILSIFKEMIQSAGYQGSPFTAMIENELLKSETIETDMADVVLQKSIAAVIEEKLN